MIKFLTKNGVYIPADVDSYKSLRRLGIPSTCFDKNFLPLLNLLTKPKGIPVEVNPLMPHIRERLDSLSLMWLKKEGRKCKSTDTRLSFTAPVTKQNKEAVAKLDNLLLTFFARWGFHYSPTYSEKNKFLKFVVDYSFAKLTPVIPIVDDAVIPTELDLILGFTKITLTFRQKDILLHIGVQAGTAWSRIHSATFLPSQVPDLKPFVLMAARLSETTIKN